MVTRSLVADSKEGGNGCRLRSRAAVVRYHRFWAQERFAQDGKLGRFCRYERCRRFGQGRGRPADVGRARVGPVRSEEGLRAPRRFASTRAFTEVLQSSVLREQTWHKSAMAKGNAAGSRYQLDNVQLS